jgi:predicted O-linked N-acetylglucosamine transferase (SPINDLY family)
LTGADALFARAIALEDSGRPEEALEHYRRLLAQAPDHADAWHNHGLLLARLGRFAEAEQSHREYIRQQPDARSHGDLADVLLALGRNAEALAPLGWILERDPDDVPALVRQGMARACLRRFAQARESFGRARARPAELERFVHRVAPGADLDCTLSPENIFLSRRYAAQQLCDWAGWDEYLAEFRAAAASPGVALEPAVAFMAFYVPLGAGERHGIARAVAARIEARAAPLPAPPPRRRPRIRIGILSPDFREHLNAYLLAPLFERCDRSRFEVYAYSLGADDGSAARKRILAAADAFRDLRTLTDADAALAIRRDDVDILVDAGGHSTGGRFAIIAQRPARLQVNYLGFPGSLGSARVDYALVDAVAADGGGGEWSEALVRLPQTYFIYDFEERIADALPARREYGLPADAFVYCAFHRAEKITPETFDLWAEILRRVPRSVLWLLAVPAAAAHNLRRAAVARGIDAGRLIFAPFEARARYLSRQRLGDLFLDALHHNAMTTACDALSAGLPVLTLRGAAFADRAGESLLRAAGLPDMVAADGEAFVRMAVRLGSDAAALGEVRTRLGGQRRSAPLFDTAARVRELSAAFEEMSARHDRGEPPRSFNLR